MTTFKHVLDDIRVLDFTQALAGPTATRLMAEMGAEVIKVELAPSGDASRGLPWFRNGRSGYYIQQNRGKKSIGVNRKDPRAIELLRRVVRECDVLVENFTPGAIARMGFGWEEVHKLNPRLVMASVSAFGQTGPLSSLPGYDYIAAAYAAVLDMIGERDGPPYFPMLGIGDVSTGVHALAAIQAAIHYRGRTGKGQYVDVSLLDSYFHCHELNVQMYTASDGQFVPRRSGAHHYAVAPAGMYKVKDGYIFIIALQNQWPNMVKALGRPEMLNDPRFADNASRFQNLKELNAIIEAALSKYDSPTAAADDLGFNYHVPSAPILSIPEAVDHPHLVERRTIREVTDPVFGTYRIPGMPLRFSEFPEELPLQADYLGQSNVEVFGKYAGLTESEIRRLEEEGVLVAKPDLDESRRP